LERIQVAIAWKEALEKHTIEGYNAFLEKYSSTSYKYSAKGKIEEIRWSEVKKSADKKQIIEFLADYTLANYLDSIDYSFGFKDFNGYMIEFEANDEDGNW
jgi:hypothetical protein